MSRQSYRLVALVAGAAILIGSLASSLASEDRTREKEQKRQVTLQQLPAPVRATIEKEAGQNKITKIEQVSRSEQQFYEAEWAAGDKNVEIKVGSDGKLLRKEVEEADDEDEDAHEPSGESERNVTEAEVPVAALAMLKKMAAGAKITEFAEEVEHGGKFYEGSWKGPAGENFDGLVSTAGALVEIEQEISADQIPEAVLAAAQNAAGKDASLSLEKKTMVLYEVHFQKGDRRVELLLSPDGRRVDQEAKKTKKHDERHEHDDR